MHDIDKGEKCTWPFFGTANDISNDISYDAFRESLKNSIFYYKPEKRGSGRGRGSNDL